MKIKTAQGHIVPIFGIYWSQSVDENKLETILLGLSPGNGGLSPYRVGGGSNDSCEIIDNRITGNFGCYSDGIYHNALIEEKLLDRIQEYDETAYTRFLEIIKSEGIVDPGFY